MWIIALFISLILVTMGLIVYEDFFHKEISVIWIASFSFIIIINSILYNKWNLTNTLINLGILLLMFITIKIVTYIKNRERSKIVNNSIGLGDIILMICFTLVFSPINYILFLDISLILGVLYYLIVKGNSLKIPLAGIFAAVYIILVVFSIGDKQNAIIFQNDLFDLTNIYE